MALGGIFSPSLPSVQAANAPSAVPSTPWYDRILPTAGAVLGGIGGAALGTVAAPFTGGVINPIDLGIAGASGGDTLGRIGENALTGQNWKNDLGSSAIQGAVGQLTGDVAAPVISGLFHAGSDVAGNLASKFVQGQVAPGQMTGSLADDLLNNYGVSNVAKSVPKIASTITGSADNEEGALANKAVMSALQNSPVPHTNVSDLFSAVDKNGAPIGEKSITQQILDQTHGLNPADQKAIINNVNLEVNKLPNAINGQTDNVSAFNLSKALANRSGDLADQAATASGSAKTSLQATSDVYDQLAKEVADRTLSPGGQDITLSPEDTQALKDNIVKSIGTSEPQAATQISKDIDNLSNADGSISARNLRSIQAKWVVANKGLSASQQLADKYGGMTTADLAKSGLPIAGAIAGGGKGLIAGATGAITKSPTIDAVAAKALDSGSDLLSGGDASSGMSLIQKLTGNKVNANASLINKLVPVLTHIGAVTAANTPNDIPSTPTNSAMPSTQGVNNVNPSAVPPASGDALSQLYNEIIAQSQTPTGISGNLVSTANTLAPQVNKQQLIAPVISNLLSSYGNAGGAQGMLGGLMSKFTGLIPGTAANTFNSQEGAAAAQIAQILGITPQQAMEMIPQLMQTQGTAAPQVSGLQGLGGSLSAVPAMQ